MAQKFAHSLSPIPLFAPYALSLPEIRRIAILKALKVGPQDPQWHKLSQVFDDMVFHCCLFLDLGYGFRTASYPFSQTRPGQVKVARRSQGLKVMTFLFLVTVKHQFNKVAGD